MICKLNHISNTIAERIDNFDSSIINECIKNMRDTMDSIHYRGQKTLSAPQIGYNLAIVIINKLIIINPTIVESSEEKRAFYIDCVEYANKRAILDYYYMIYVKYRDINNHEQIVAYKDVEAAYAQHQIDNINGLPIINRLLNGISDLFVPREVLYCSSYVPLKNYGIVVSIRQKLRQIKPQTFMQYYSMLLNGDYNYKEYIISSYKKRSLLVELIIKYANQGKMLEAGCGTSALSIYLAREGFDIECIDIDDKILSMAKRINDSLLTSVKYSKQNLFKMDYRKNSFALVFSHGVLEHFSKDEIIMALKEALRVADICIISVPTIWDISNNLLGDEHLWTISKWEKLIVKNGYTIIEKKRVYISSKQRRLSRIIPFLPSGNIVFVVRQIDRVQ